MRARFILMLLYVFMLCYSVNFAFLLMLMASCYGFYASNYTSFVMTTPTSFVALILF
jgi:hypothetical protein